MRVRVAVGLLLFAGCGQARPIVDGVQACLTWKQEIAPLFAARCAQCHPAGATYDVTSYLTALVETSGKVIARSGQVDSRIVTALSDATHVAAGVGDVLAEVQRWVVTCDLDYEVSAVHAGGIMNPADANFHGALVRSLGWKLSTCATCHGSDFSGGTSGASCLTCHEGAGGPTGCTTCHGQPPATGAHLAHASGAIARPFDCTECHVKPHTYTDVGHLFAADGGVIPEAIVTLKSGAWDGMSCQNSDCHGAGFVDTHAKNRAPLWRGGTTQAACGTCHGLPPSNHALTQCSDCHVKVIDANGALIDRSRHVDGKISLGDESGTCTACHGQPPATGAHVAHMTAAHELRGPLACTDCHVVPLQLNDPGHIDGSPVVVFGALAHADSTQPVWLAATATCGVYCHGAATPSWQGGVAQIECGSCHGIPPASHQAGLTLASCASCHSRTMDATGAFVVGGAHINGVVDVGP